MRQFLLAVLVVAAISGCSGLGNVGIGPGSNESFGGSFTPFGGVQASSTRVSEGIHDISTKGLQFYIPLVSETMGLAVLADVPCSLAVDVVTLPVCLFYRMSAKPQAPPADVGNVVEPVK